MVDVTLQEDAKEAVSYLRKSLPTVSERALLTTIQAYIYNLENENEKFRAEVSEIEYILGSACGYEGLEYCGHANTVCKRLQTLIQK